MREELPESRREISQNFSPAGVMSPFVARAMPARLSDERLTGEWQTGVETMSGCPQRKLRLFFAPSPATREASQIDDPPKDGWDNITFPLDIYTPAAITKI